MGRNPTSTTIARKANRLHRNGMGNREIARALGCSHSTVKILLDRTKPKPPAPEKPVGITFRTVSRGYYCEGCERVVTVAPCPACVARASAGRKTG